MTESDGSSCESRNNRIAGQRLEFMTLGWNGVEAFVAVSAGWLANSSSLVGFGVDSIIESLSGVVILWRLSMHQADASRDKQALRLVGICFFILAAWVAWEACASLIEHEPPTVSITGIVLASLSIVVMPLLARAKRRLALKMGSAALLADSRQTNLCAWLSVILLGGLALHALLGWWWADPVAALLMAPVIFSEGCKAMRGQTCSGCC